MKLIPLFLCLLFLIGCDDDDCSYTSSAVTIQNPSGSETNAVPELPTLALLITGLSLCILCRKKVIND